VPKYLIYIVLFQL